MQAVRPAAPATLKVEVLRMFQNHERKMLKPGEIAVLPRIFALEMAAAKKVAIIDEAPAASAPAPASEPAKAGAQAGKKEK